MKCVWIKSFYRIIQHVREQVKRRVINKVGRGEDVLYIVRSYTLYPWIMNNILLVVHPEKIQAQINCVENDGGYNE